MHTFNVVPFASFNGRSIPRIKCSLIDGEQKLVDKIRGRISKGKVEMLGSASAYDTAWVAMVPSREYSGGPSFPQCLDWIMENQNPDGSWGVDPGNPFLIKDSLSCTLACLLALRKWNMGNHFLQRGMDFIKSNCWAATQENQLPLIGFNIIFPSMINQAKKLDLALPLPQTLIHSLLHLRDLEIRKQKWEYVAEGVIEESCKWKQIITTHQRRNGSLFDSPATTAAAAIHSRDHKCYDYLISILERSDGSVSTIYPMHIYTRLCMIDTLQRLGIHRYFEAEINIIFDEIYRNWEEREEEIFGSVTCQALAFRLLRMQGYHVSSEELGKFVDEEGFLSNVSSMQHNTAGAVLELFRASHARINQRETVLDRIYAWTKPFLKHHLLTRTIRDKRLEKQVEYDLKNLYGAVDRFQNRRTIDLYDARCLQVAKSAYLWPAVYNEDFYRFSIQDFKISRAQYLKELEQMSKWYSDCRLDLLSKGRNVCRETYILTAAFIVDPHLSMARISFAQVILLITVLDDFFDRYGSQQQALSIINLIKQWKIPPTYCSKEVEVLFSALHDTINDVAAKAHAEQGFCSKKQLIGLWVELLESAVKEKDPQIHVSTLDEYLTFAPDTIGCKTCVMTSIHFLGVKLSEEIWTSMELSSLCRYGDIVCRLLNDLKTYKRESEENTLNSVSVQTAGGGVSEEEAVAKVEEMVEYHRRKVMGMVCGKNRTSIPRECKELVWKTCKLAYCFYANDGGGDEFSSPQDILKDINAMMFEPLPLDP